MTTEFEALETIRALNRRGAYRAAGEYADRLTTEIKTRPLIALERARGFLRQGCPNLAAEALGTGNLALATPGEKLILAVEQAATRIIREAAVIEALSDAQSAFALAGDIPDDDPDRAEAERIQVRIILSARTYYLVTAAEGQAGVDRLPRLADILERSGRFDRAAAARISYAEQLEDPIAGSETLMNIAGQAEVWGFMNLAAEAHLARAGKMKTGDFPESEVSKALDAAEGFYRKGEHAHGLIDVRVFRTKLAIERHLASPSELKTFPNEFRQIEYYKGELSVLMDLSLLAHQRGDTIAAGTYRQQILDLSDRLGLGLARDSNQTAEIDLLMRKGDYGRAIELCEAAIANRPPQLFVGLYKLLLASAYSFVSDYERACSHGRQAIEILERSGATDSVSDAVTKLASDLNSLRNDPAWDEAEELLEKWCVVDEKRGDLVAAIGQLSMLAQIKIVRYLYSPTYRGQADLLNAAEGLIAAAEKIAPRLPEREALCLLGNLQQMRGQIDQARGNEDQVIRDWRDSLEKYQRAEAEMEVANCHFMLGVIYLNRANQSLMENFQEAETNLRSALEYYDRAGVRAQSADTHYMFALLYANASLQTIQDLSTQLIEVALGHLRAGESDYDALRQEFSAGGSIPEIQKGKRGLIEKSRRIYDQALYLVCRVRPDPTDAWNWVQRAKARSLSDVLGTGSSTPTRVIAQLEKYPGSFELVQRERALAEKIGQASAAERVGLRQQLAAERARMAQDPLLAEYLELRLGAVPDAGDLTSMFAEDGTAGQACVCLDWFAVGDSLFLLAVRPGEPPALVPLAISLSAVQEFVYHNLGPDTFRVTLRDTPEILRSFNPLIEPLAALTNRGELLVVSLTGPLHALPLHALELDGAPLLVRNPIVYCPSLGVLRQCLARHHDRPARPIVTLLGDPSGDRPEAANLVRHLEQFFDTKALIGPEVTCSRFLESMASADWIHFQGHATHEPSQPLDSFLSCADGRLTANEVFGLSSINSELLTLAACESAASVIAPGDEPLGLIPAFLFAGTSSVLATLWKVNQTSAALTMRKFYENLSNRNSSLDKALALREAMLTVRSAAGFDSPYHWAPFVLHGDWH